ncbi:hypothetical protein J6590_082260, partial [Homalodisca vitripennis]
FQLTTSTTESRLRRTLKLPYRSVLQFVAPDFQSDMPKVRNAVEGRQNPVGAQPFDGIPPPRRRGMEWGMRCVGNDSRPDTQSFLDRSDYMPGHRSWFQRTGTTMTSQTVTPKFLK